MGVTRRSHVSYFILLFLLPVAACLYCYQCGNTGSGGFCETDTKTIVKSARHAALQLNNSTNPDVEVIDTDNEGRTQPYIKKCSNSRNVCMIETIENAQTSAMLSYIRDCSDGKTFSYGNLSMLQGIEHNNFTTCAYDTLGYMTCVTTCDTNFCNGPKAGATSLMMAVALQIACLLCVFRMTCTSL
ncbi:uncharacterized protein LOC124144911 isoform X1 [Haliotis rufescens]|uniref:uncharacterized protein LOC124144911 isoform X1 n=1 Tax=Haliotis rufescens TaxID=6454 RepID=UPI00201F6764|nr:uncharacterized protein LOC124144911 isoform X1 [Haliotis rufescens]